MPTYAITFTIDYDTHESWNRRYDSFMTAVRQCPVVWLETTSFCLVQTSETLAALEQRLWLTSFDSTKDKMVVINVSYDDAICRGAIKDRAKLETLLPGIQKK
jgi:hypothetical protein